MTTRRRFLQTAAVATTALGAPLAALSQQPQRSFTPQPGPWRTFEVTTRVEVTQPQGAVRLWLPVPSVNTEWQQSLESSFSSNGRAHFATDAQEGTRMLQVVRHRPRSRRVAPARS